VFSTGIACRDEVVIASAAGWIVRGKVTLACCFGVLASVTEIDTEDGPATVGVPLIKPLELADNPLGKFETDHVYGVVPPVARNWNEYAVPAVPLDKAVVEIDRPVPIVMESEAVVTLS
jgi:hypothetical protein